jgi:hypothetical protein
VSWLYYICIVQAFEICYTACTAIEKRLLLSIPYLSRTITSLRRSEEVSEKHQKYNKIIYSDRRRRTATILMALDSSATSAGQEMELSNCPPRLYLELAPLIGAPSFLPVHVKVVLETTAIATATTTTTTTTSNVATTTLSPADLSADVSSFAGNYRKYYKWDFIPYNATEQSTITKLLQLQPVPGLIRCQDENKNTITVDRTVQSYFFLQHQQQENTILQKGFDFCHKYTNNELHLIFNNCWTFAIPLYLHLYMSLKRQ